jgi:hypothetical protein
MTNKLAPLSPTLAARTTQSLSELVVQKSIRGCVEDMCRQRRVRDWLHVFHHLGTMCKRIVATSVAKSARVACTSPYGDGALRLLHCNKNRATR